MTSLLHFSAPPSSTAARMSTRVPSPVYPYGVESSFRYSITIISVVLVGCFFIIGFFSFYIRRRFQHSAAAAAEITRVAMQKNHRHGLDASIINSFPVFPYSTVKHLKIGKGALQCVVCIMEFQDDDFLRLLPNCDHVFHQDCIDVWLASHTTCPVCRSELTQKVTSLCETSAMPSPDHPIRSQQSSTAQDTYINIPNSQLPPALVDQDRRRMYRDVKFSRSHSTGHSLVQSGENCERYTLRLPEKVKRRIVKLSRTKSCDVVMIECGGAGGEGSSRGRTNSDGWMFTKTPPFLAKTNSPGKGEGEASHSSTCKSPITLLRRASF